MRWAVFAIFAALALILQMSFVQVFRLDALGGLMPDVVACLAVFVSLFAHRLRALWACWILGLLMDLSLQDSTVPNVIGPNALGYVFGGYLVLQLRTMVFRRRAITIGFLTFVFLLGSGVVAVFILMIRDWYPHSEVLPQGALRELLDRFGVAVYSAIFGIGVGWLLNATAPLWAFQSGMPRRTAW